MPRLPLIRGEPCAATRRPRPPHGPSRRPRPATAQPAAAAMPPAAATPDRPKGRQRRLGIILRQPYIQPVVVVGWSCDMVMRPRDLASRMAARRKPDDGYLRET